MAETHEKREETHACDLISRRAAIDALGEEPLVWHEDDVGEVAERNQWRRDVAAIKALPSAQPEIIHCKDCKYNPNPPECGNAACVLFYGMTDQMGFCHHGERRKRE